MVCLHLIEKNTHLNVFIVLTFSGGACYSLNNSSSPFLRLLIKSYLCGSARLTERNNMKLRALSSYNGDSDTRFGDCILIYGDANLVV